MDDPAALIHVPLGAPGSGRVRYGAAMALYRAGRLGPAQLEVYRETAAHDGRDPAFVLAERGLPPVPAPPDSAKGALTTLCHLAEDYLNGLSHPGAAEVRAGLARRQRSVRAQTGAPHPVADRWLGPALASMDTHLQPLTRAIAAARPHLRWVSYDGYPRALIGEDFAAGHANALIIGEDGPFRADDFNMGLLLIAPDTLHRDHNHAAPELYAPLTGPHGWRFGLGRALMLKPAHQPVWNPPFQPHMTKVGPLPFLALYVWTQNLDQPVQVLSAGDWPELESLRLG